MKHDQSTNPGYLEIRNVTLVGALVDFVLGVVKIVSGLLGHSYGLVADGIHSLSDLATDSLVVWAAKQGSQVADSEHPYGHERIQTVATVLLSIALIMVALGIAYDAVGRLLSPESLLAPGKLTLIIALISILAKEWIYHYTMRVARRTRSKLLQANAWHSRSDALSSVVVLLGILGTMAGLTYFDAVAAIIVAAMIAYIGWRLGSDSVHELIDTGLDKSHLRNMRKTMLSVQGVRDIHQLRTRRMGPQVVADVHVRVPPEISVSEGHRISEEVERALIEELEDPADITVHIDCEEDQEGPPAYLPLREELLPALQANWAEISDLPVERITLHYLAEKIAIEICVSAADADEAHNIKRYEQLIRQKYASDQHIAKIDVVLAMK